MISRSNLIQQLRQALHQAESPSNEFVEFVIGDTEFCFDYSDSKDKVTTNRLENDDNKIYGIYEASAIVGCSAGTLRSYHKQGIVHPEIVSNGRRLFSNKDIIEAKKKMKAHNDWLHQRIKP